MTKLRTDRPLVAGLLGAVATVPYELLMRVLQALGIARYTAYELSSLTITLNRPTAALGVVSSGIIGAVAAFLLYRALRQLGTDYLVLKGIATGLIVWMITEVVFVWLIEGPGLIAVRPVSDYAAHLVGAAVYGATMGWLLRRYLIPNEQ